MLHGRRWLREVLQEVITWDSCTTPDGFPFRRCCLVSLAAEICFHFANE